MEETAIEQNYLRHIANEKKKVEQNQLPTTYVNPGSVNAWRAVRMRNTLLPLIGHYPGTKWMTIGDGEFGSDANFLLEKGLDVMATSISEETLAEASRLGRIGKYKRMNAENITETDNAYDFCFCKEALHHLPRPPIGLYEMLRVARKGVVLIEPQEHKPRILDRLKKFMKLRIREDQSIHFEPVGNYIYRISLRQLSKIMNALGLSILAYKRFNDFHMPALADMPMKKGSRARTLTLLGIGLQNVLCALRLMDFGLATAVLFKSNPGEELLSEMRKAGYRIIKLPRNPYL